MSGDRELVAIRGNTMAVHILDTQTGETVIHYDRYVEIEKEDYDERGKYMGWSDFIWTDGNYRCDCNRSLFFRRSKGTDEPETKCGDERFKIKIVREDGVVLLDEIGGEG